MFCSHGFFSRFVSAPQYFPSGRYTPVEIFPSTQFADLRSYLVFYTFRSEKCKFSTVVEFFQDFIDLFFHTWEVSTNISTSLSLSAVPLAALPYSMILSVRFFSMLNEKDADRFIVDIKKDSIVPNT